MAKKRETPKRLSAPRPSKHEIQGWKRAWDEKREAWDKERQDAWVARIPLRRLIVFELIAQAECWWDDNQPLAMQFVEMAVKILRATDYATGIQLDDISRVLKLNGKETVEVDDDVPADVSNFLHRTWVREADNLVNKLDTPS